MDGDLPHMAREGAVGRQDFAANGQTIVLHTHRPIGCRHIVLGQLQLGRVSATTAPEVPKSLSVVEVSATLEADSGSDEYRNITWGIYPTWTAAIPQWLTTANQH